MAPDGTGPDPEPLWNLFRTCLGTDLEPDQDQALPNSGHFITIALAEIEDTTCQGADW